MLIKLCCEICSIRTCSSLFHLPLNHSPELALLLKNGFHLNYNMRGWCAVIALYVFIFQTQVAVHDYICKSHDTESNESSCDPQQQDETLESAVGTRGVTSHISVCTVYPNGFQELYRHFLRLPDGAIIEVFGDISALRFVPSEVIPAVEKHIREMDTVQREIFASAQEEGEVSVKIKGDY